MLAANNERQFADLCRVLKHPQWSADLRWADPIARRDNQEALRELFEQVFLTAPATHWEALLDAAGVPASRVRRLSETVAEGQLQARGMLSELEVGEDATLVSLPGVGFRLNGASLIPDQPPRPAGADAPKWSES
jgi:crotonobetainyl-CoA:carnitine CoA-transferase CaiB-like acyl-CoA transferase